MENKYKVILQNRRICREIELDENRNELTVGTDVECDVRFNRDSFLYDFDFSIRKVKDIWQIRCGNTTYISDSNSMKYASKGLNHGDSYSIKDKDSGTEIFRLTFTLNFDLQGYCYNTYIDLSGKREISFGHSDRNDVVLKDSLLDEKVALLSVSENGWVIEDCSSKYGIFVNGRRISKSTIISDYDFFSILGYSFYLRENKLYYDSNVSVLLNGISSQPVARIGSCLEYPKFNRNTRLKYKMNEEPIHILDPDKKPEKPKSNIIMSILPSLASVVLIVVLRGGMLSGEGSFLQNLSGNSYILFSVATMGVGIATSILSIINGKKEYREGIAKRKSVYLKYIEKKGKEIDEIRRQEADLLNDVYISIDKELEQVKEFSGDLFNKSVGDEDFLHVRLGSGMLPAKRVIDYKKQEQLETDDELIQKPENLYNEFKDVDNVPIVVKLNEINSLGVVGTSDMLYNTMKNMIIDLCVRHYHNDVKLFFILSKEDAPKFYWARWFQNLNNDALGIKNIVCDDESKNNLFEYLYSELSRRESEKVTVPNVVVLVFDDVGIKLHPLSKYVSKAKELGFSFVFFEEYKELLPVGCENIVLLNPDGNSGRLIPSEDVNSACDFKYSTISDEDALFISQRISSVYCEEVGLESGLTKNITLFDLLHIFSPKDLDLESRWNSSVIYKSMAAPLGVKRKNEVVSLDLHEKFHGPHGLVAGTTGSGKSEILQSYILSMCTLFHPYEVGFVIIDFKGGGMVNQFKNLPHLIGAITNIDGDEINRSLLSIKAELLKRQNLFADAEVNHIDQYIKKYKNGEVKTALPHLIIIVDEFAELKAEQPDFMKELISAARIGRSLGVHLILATQKPAGQVNEQIWSNSKFKLCLKVQTQEDSNEVLKSPLAAEIKEPGRAYLQVGNNEIFELFQSAYSGASASTAENETREYVINQVAFSGVRTPVFVQKKQKNDKGGLTQLQALVDYIDDYCKNKKIAHLPDICLPPLKEVIDIEEAEIFSESSAEMFDTNIPIGIYDDPAHQYQGVIKINLAEENVMLIGSSRFGKTNFLQVIIRSLACRFSPEEVNIYILDFASMVLKNFESLNHVGGVVCASDDEKLKNFFKLINGEIAARKKILVNAGVSSFSSYREAGYTDLPHIVIVVDNLTVLKEMYFQDDDPLLVICREGLTVGITVIIANSQTSGIGYKYLANFSSRIALYCNDSSEYANIFDSCRKKPKTVPGRCIVTYQKEYYECQTYLAFNGDKEIDRVNNMKEFIAETNEMYSGMRAKVIPEIPELLNEEYISSNFSYLNKQDESIVVGIDYSSVEPVTFEINSISVLAVSGRAKSGKSNFVRYLIKSFERKNTDMKLYVIDDITRKYGDFNGVCEKYTINPSDVEGIINLWNEELSRRYDVLMDGDSNALKYSDLLVLVINNYDVAGQISNNSEIFAKYKNIITKYKNLKMCIIYANLPNESITYNSPEVFRLMKDNKNVVVFDDLQNLKAFDLEYSIIKQFKKPIEKGDGYWIKGNDCIKMKTPLIQNR